jgi:site-specific recombinase XerD
MNDKEAVLKLREVARMRHLALATEDSYAGWVVRFARFVRERCREGKPAVKMEAFLTQIARQGVAASTQNQAFCALLFFYRDVLKMGVGEVDALRAKTPIHKRYAPEVQDVMAVLANARVVGGCPTSLILKLLYGCGMRVSEALNLRLVDVQLSESMFMIRSAKGGKDRPVAIPCSLVRELETQMAVALAVSQSDSLKGIPVKLPGLLAKKYPRWQFATHWAWLFPAKATCNDPRSGAVVRWHCHPANVRRSLSAAARPLGLEFTPHHLRHSYATHVLNRGGNVRAVQEALGHKHLDTTMVYVHADALSVRSPLDHQLPQLSTLP